MNSKICIKRILRSRAQNDNIASSRTAQKQKANKENNKMNGGI